MRYSMDTVDESKILFSPCIHAGADGIPAGGDFAEKHPQGLLNCGPGVQVNPASVSPGSIFSSTIDRNDMANDLDLLQGTWTVTKLEVDGQKLSEDMLGEARLIVKGNR